MTDNMTPNTSSTFVNEYSKRILAAINYQGYDDHEDLITILKEIEDNNSRSSRTSSYL